MTNASLFLSSTIFLQFFHAVYVLESPLCVANSCRNARTGLSISIGEAEDDLRFKAKLVDLRLFPIPSSMPFG